MQTTFTREYKNVKAARHDIAHQAKRGYEVASMTEIAQRAGLGRWLLIGWLSIVFKPKPHVLVAYRLTNSQVFQIMGERGYPEPVRVAPSQAPSAATLAQARPDLYMTDTENLETLKRIPIVIVTETQRMWHALTTKFER